MHLTSVASVLFFVSLAVAQVIVTITSTITVTPTRYTSTITKIATVTAPLSSTRDPNIVTTTTCRAVRPGGFSRCETFTFTITTPPVVKPSTVYTTVIATAQPDECPAPLYYQCGGKNWDGCTQCTSGHVCVKSNEFYSQCREPSSKP